MSAYAITLPLASVDKWNAWVRCPNDCSSCVISSLPAISINARRVISCDAFMRLMHDFADSLVSLWLKRNGAICGWVIMIYLCGCADKVSIAKAV